MIEYFYCESPFGYKWACDKGKGCYFPCDGLFENYTCGELALFKIVEKVKNETN